MRFSAFAAIAALGSTALAQSVPGLPSCAATCFGNNLGSCGQLDIACICGNTPVITSVSCCVFATCSQADITTTINFAVAFCKAQGVTVNTSPSCPAGSSTLASGSGSASASAASSVSGSMTAMVSGVTGSALRSTTPTASAAGSSGAAPAPTAGGFGMGLAGALAGLLAQAVL